MDKPDHLRPEAPSSSWIAGRAAGAAAGVLGILAFAVVAISQDRLWSTPDWRVSVPGLALTALAAGVSIARRERGAYPIWLIGLGFAAASLALGWVLMVAVVIGATAILMLILHALM